MKVRRFMGGTWCSVVALGVGGAGDYRGGGAVGCLLEGMGALREGMEWKDFGCSLGNESQGRPAKRVK